MELLIISKFDGKGLKWISKIELVKIILNIENGNFINKVMDFISNEKSDLWNEPTESEQEEIKIGITQLDNGKRTPYMDVLKMIS